MNNIRFTDEELREIIEQHITGPNKALLCAAIFGLLGDQDWKKALLLKASLGSIPKNTLVLNDMYLVKKDHLSTYDMDDTLTKEAGLLTESGEFQCKLIAFLPWELSNYRVSYSYLRADGTTSNRQYDLSSDELTIAEEFPEE